LLEVRSVSVSTSLSLRIGWLDRSRTDPTLMVRCRRRAVSPTHPGERLGRARLADDQMSIHCGSTVRIDADRP
jgi:hypothetical protein